MADEEKAKAEKLAAAKKRVEALKKQSKTKKGGAKKKEEKADTSAEAEAAADKADDAAADEETADSNANAPAEESKSAAQDTSVRSPTVTTHGETASDIYKKQVQRIEELEKENKQLAADSQKHEKRWRESEEELEGLREVQGEVAELKGKEAEVEKLNTEIAALQRQNSQLQSQAARKRSTSTASPNNADDLNSQLASKLNTIQSLELDLSNAHSRITELEKTNASQADKITSLETDLTKAQESRDLLEKELADLKSTAESTSTSASEDASSAEKRLAQLEASLKSAQRATESATGRASTLEKKVETLTTLHREADARHQAKQREHAQSEREAKEVRSRVTFLTNENSRLREASERHKKASAEGDDGEGVDELLDEERSKLLARIRSLEEEATDLRRGVWRERRREMQPGLEASGDESGFFDDVDLNNNNSHALPQRGTQQRGSSFTDVLQSGISAFTGQPRHDLRRGSTTSSHKAQGQQQGLGLVDEEDDDEFAFDEDAFAKAQAEEQARRLERVREVKRGLKDWVGWRVDIVDVRVGMGGVFDV